MFAACLNYRHLSGTDSDVGTSSGSVYTYAVGDKILLIQNVSDTAVFLNLSGAAAEVDKGMRIPPIAENGAVTIYAPRNGINAIHGGSGTKQLLITIGN